LSPELANDDVNDGTFGDRDRPVRNGFDEGVVKRHAASLHVIPSRTSPLHRSQGTRVRQAAMAVT
jgi:hypothetical protein